MSQTLSYNTSLQSKLGTLVMRHLVKPLRGSNRKRVAINHCRSWYQLADASGVAGWMGLEHLDYKRSNPAQ
jgi:hypothetical protein